jgi:hypothetical protein
VKSYQGIVNIEAPLEAVWDFIRDPDAIGRSMPDMVEYQVEDANHLRAKVRVGVGPVRAVFDVAAELTVLPEPYQVRLQMQGGGVGSGFQMVSTMRISESEEQLSLNWTAEVQVSGPLATLGGRVLDNQVKKITQQVFENIRQGLLPRLSG